MLFLLLAEEGKRPPRMRDTEDYLPAHTLPAEKRTVPHRSCKHKLPEPPWKRKCSKTSLLPDKPSNPEATPFFREKRKGFPNVPPKPSTWFPSPLRERSGVLQAPSLLGPLQIFAGTGIHHHTLTYIDEHGNRHGKPRLQRGGLTPSGNGISLESGIRLHHLKLHGFRKT